MSTILIRPNERSVLRKVTCDCKQPADCDNILCHTLSANYLIGKAAPNYPVPAILCRAAWSGSGDETWLLIDGRSDVALGNDDILLAYK